MGWKDVALVAAGGFVGAATLSWLGYPALVGFGCALLASLPVAALAGWGARRWVDDLPLARWAFGGGLIVLAGFAAAWVLPRRIDAGKLRDRLRSQVMLATVGKRSQPLTLDRAHFGPYEPAARYLITHAERLTPAAQAFRGGTGMLNHMYTPKNLGIPEGRAAVRVELAKVDAALQELKLQIDPLLSPGLEAGLKEAGVTETVIQALSADWRATSHFRSVGDLITNQREFLEVARSILENLEADKATLGPDGRLKFTDRSRFDRQHALMSRFRALAGEALRLGEATRIYIPK